MGPFSRDYGTYHAPSQEDPDPVLNYEHLQCEYKSLQSIKKIVTNVGAGPPCKTEAACKDLSNTEVCFLYQCRHVVHWNTVLQWPFKQSIVVSGSFE